MNADQDLGLNILSRLGSHPAIAFYEAGVAGEVRAALSDVGVGFVNDQFGNIVAHLPGGDPSVEIPPIIFVAHMDHPGFEAVERDGDYLVGQAAGGVPSGAFSEGVPVLALLADGGRIPAEIAGRHGDESQRRALIRLKTPQALQLPRPVVFDLADFELDGDFIRMRALDDLAGCASILAALTELVKEPPAGDVYGVFTRAEEVGLVGARAMAEAGTLPGNALVVSLESSRTLPGAEIGGGPVIRVGDAGSTFDAEAESALVKARETLQERDAGFRVQRQLMSGGVCEASAFARYGYRATGIAFPLGNYHNGAPEDKIEAEYIHREDFRGGIALIVEAARSVSQRRDTLFRRRLAVLPEELRRRLEE